MRGIVTAFHELANGKARESDREREREKKKKKKIKLKKTWGLGSRDSL